MIGKYSNENGSAAATRKFQTHFPNLNESTVREFQKKYRAKLHEAAKQGKSIERRGLVETLKEEGHFFWVLLLMKMFESLCQPCVSVAVEFPFQSLLLLLKF